MPIQAASGQRLASAHGAAGETPHRTLLLLAGRGEPWGLAAARAANAAGYRVRRLGRPDGLFKALDSDDQAAAAVLVVSRALPAGDRKHWAARLSDRTADARLHLFLLDGDGSDSPALEALGNLPHVTVFTAPPAERVLTSVLRAARREMDRRDHVNRLLNRLEEAGQRKDRLLARVGHELRNPLGAITCALTLMRELEAPESDTCRYRRLIERQVETLTRAVDEMLDLTGDRVTDLSADGEGEGGFANDNGTRSGHDSERGGDGPPGEAPSVLLVEDDADGRQALTELLRMWGYEVRVAVDGETGVEAVGRRPPAVALVDIGLPGMDGYEVARHIRRHHPEPPPLLIAMTGFGQPEDRKRALDAGFDLHMVKPIRPARLAELLRERGRS